MKTESFIAGLAIGAVATVAISKKFFNGKLPDDALKDAEGAVEKLRSSVDSLKTELNKRIESEQTFAAKCEELNEQVAKQSAEINNLKNICDAQNGMNKKLEEELAEAKSGK
ncbi:MAG: hypothetical protein MJY82_06320 [Fibrobacter sp.]|nr:hypothetical protein [Fibrobacter sp.]